MQERVRLEDGSALADTIPSDVDYTLLHVGSEPLSASSFEAAFAAAGARLAIRTIPDAAARTILERRLVLVRADLHVVRRGDEAPADASEIVAVATGRRPRARTAAHRETGVSATVTIDAPIASPATANASQNASTTNPTARDAAVMHAAIAASSGAETLP